jgi:hypothetical protein
VEGDDVGPRIEQVYDRRRFVVTPPEETDDMAEQLPLPQERTPWRLDERTREAGRRGIASARAALAAHRPVDEPRRQAA